MKKLLFILLTIIFLTPNVSAETVQMTPNLNYWEQDVQTFSNKTLYGGKYWGVYTGNEQYFTTARFVFDYSFPVQGDVYNVYFWLVAEGLTPIFSLNDIPCTVVPSYINSNGVNTGLNMVACIDIPYSNKFEVILKGSWAGTSQGQHFGLSNTVTINRFSTSDSALKQGVDTLNNQMAQNNQIIQDTNDKIGDLNDNITNDNVDGVENSFESFEGFVSENSTITQLITMPITLYSSILNGLQSSCQPFVLGNLFGTNLTLPCINIGNYLGTVLWSMIDIIISGFAIFSISKKLIKIFNNFSSMKEGDVIDD